MPNGDPHKKQSANGSSISNAFDQVDDTKTIDSPPKIEKTKHTTQVDKSSIGNAFDEALFKKKDGTPDGGIKSSPIPLNGNGLQSQEEPIKSDFEFGKVYVQQPTPIEIAKKTVQDYQKQKDNLKSSIVNYGKQYNVELDPNEILSSADKASDFLQKIKSASAKAIQESQSRISSMKGGEMVKAQTELPDVSLFTMSKEMNDYISSLKDHVVLQTIKEEPDKQQAIVKIAKRLDPKGFKKSEELLSQTNDKTGSPQTAKGDAYNKLFSDEKNQDELLNSVKGKAELEYNNGLQQLANNKISEGILSNNKQLIEEGKADLASVDNDVLYKNPSLLKQEIVRRVSEELARESGQMEGSDTINEGAKITGGTAGDRFRLMKDMGYFDDPRTRDIAMQLVNQPSLFADASYFGGMVDNSISPFKNLGLWLGDVTGARSEKDVYTDHIRDQMFPKEQEGTKPDIKNVPIIGDIKIRHVANTTANLAGMAVMAATTEGIGTELGLTATTAQRLGAYTSFGLPSYDQNLKDSYDFTDNPVTRTLYGTMGALLNAEGGRFLDLGKLSRTIPKVGDIFSKIATGLSEKTLTEDATKELLNKGKNAYLDAALKYGKNVTKGAATMAYFNATNNILRLGFGDPNIKASDIVPQAANAFMDGVTGMSIMGAFGAAADMRNEKNTTYKGFLYNMAINHDASADVFKTGLDKGLYTKEAYDEKISILNTSRVAKNTLDAAQTERGILLNENQKAVYVANKTAENFLRAKAEKTENTELKSKYEKQANELNKQSKDIFEGLHFTDTLEPLYDLFDAEKKYNEELEKFKSGESKDDTGLLAAKEKYNDLQYKYFEQNKQPSNEKDINAKTEDAKGEKSKSEISQAPEGEEREGLLKQATDLVKSGIEITGFSAEPIKQAANENPKVFESYLKDIAEQAHDERSSKLAIDTYGKELVDLSKQLFPHNKTETDGKKESSQESSQSGEKGSKSKESNGKGDDVTDISNPSNQGTDAENVSVPSKENKGVTVTPPDKLTEPIPLNKETGVTVSEPLKVNEPIELNPEVTETDKGKEINTNDEIQKEHDNIDAAIEGANLDENKMFEGKTVDELLEDKKLLADNPKGYFAKQVADFQKQLLDKNLKGKDREQAQIAFDEYNKINNAFQGKEQFTNQELNSASQDLFNKDYKDLTQEQKDEAEYEASGRKAQPTEPKQPDTVVGSGVGEDVYYHGTGESFTDFTSEGEVKSATGNPTSVWGNFFTKNKDEANRYVKDFHGGKGKVVEANLELKNPYEMSATEFNSFTTPKDLSNPKWDEMKQKAADFKKQLQDEGYDGIVIHKGRKFEETVVFDKSQIKSLPTQEVKANTPKPDTVVSEGDINNHPDIKKLEEERDAEIKKVVKPDVSLNFVDESKIPEKGITREVLNEDGDKLKDEIVPKKKLIKEQKDIMDKVEKLKQLITCLTK